VPIDASNRGLKPGNAGVSAYGRKTEGKLPVERYEKEAVMHKRHPPSWGGNRRRESRRARRRRAREAAPSAQFPSKNLAQKKEHDWGENLLPGRCWFLE